jgi:hypothetical protein
MKGRIMATTHDPQSITALAVKHARNQAARRYAKRLKALAAKKTALTAQIRDINRKIDESVDTDAIGREVLLELVALQTSGQASSIDQAFQLLTERYQPADESAEPSEVVEPAENDEALTGHGGDGDSGDDAETGDLVDEATEAEEPTLGRPSTFQPSFGQFKPSV